MGPKSLLDAMKMAKAKAAAKADEELEAVRAAAKVSPRVDKCGRWISSLAVMDVGVGCCWRCWMCCENGNICGGDDDDGEGKERGEGCMVH